MMPEKNAACVDATDLSNFVLECLESMQTSDRMWFFDRLAEEYCTLEYGCGQAIDKCQCDRRCMEF